MERKLPSKTSSGVTPEIKTVTLPACVYVRLEDRWFWKVLPDEVMEGSRLKMFGK